MDTGSRSRQTTSSPRTSARPVLVGSGLSALLGLTVLLALIAPSRALAQATPASSARPLLGALPGQVTAISKAKAVPKPKPTPKPKLVGFGVVPATARDLDLRALFSFGLTPGSVAYDHVAVVNYSNKKMALDVYATDALNAAGGGFTLRAAKERPFDLGAWVAVGDGRRRINVPGRRKDGSPGRVILPLSITVPHNATPGDHAAGIVASLSTLGKNPQGQNIRLDQRVASRVYLRVDGPLQPGLIVTALKAHFTKGSRPWRHGAVVVDYTLSNTGNLRMGFRPSVNIAGPFGVGAHTVAAAPVAELLPGNSQTFRTRVSDVWPMIRLDVTVGATPVAAIAAESPGLKPISESIKVWAVVWQVLVALILLVALVVLLCYRWVRRLRAKRAGNQDSGNSGNAKSGNADPSKSNSRGLPARTEETVENSGAR